MRFAMVVVVALLCLPAAARADEGELFAGEWKNLEKTLTLVGARIYPQGGRWMVQLLGACQPVPCVWEPVPLTFHPTGPFDPPAPATAMTTPEFGNLKVTLRLGEDALQVTIVQPRPGPHGTTFVDVLTRVKATTTPLPTMVRGPRPAPRK
jgi:hypothetical protein